MEKGWSATEYFKVIIFSHTGQNSTTFWMRGRDRDRDRQTDSIISHDDQVVI